MKLPRFFRFREESAPIDLDLAVAREPRMARFRAALARRVGDEAADNLVFDMLTVALRELGDHFDAMKRKDLERLTELRNRLDDLYHDLRGAAPGEFARKLEAAGPEIDQLYRNLDHVLAALAAKPGDLLEGPANVAADLRALIKAATPSPLPGVVRSIFDDFAVDERGTARIARKQFEVVGPHKAVGHFDEGTVVLEVHGGKYRVTTTDQEGFVHSFEEYDVLHTAYRRKPTTGGLVQAHHGVMDAMMAKAFGAFGYAKDDAPTIWLRDQVEGSPHKLASNNQNAKLDQRRPLNYENLRRWAVEDLALARTPDAKIAEYMGAMDAYFIKRIWPSLPKDEAALTALLGSWRPKHP
ncbi:MAG: hypothetical protein U1F43_34150 [Myxococcota bacterium]